METSHCKWSMCIGRVLLGLFFVALGALNLHSWSDTVALLVAHHVPVANVMLGIATAIEIVFGALLALGWLRCLSSIVLILYVAFISIYLCDFWVMAGAARHMALMHCLWNIGIIGGLLCAGSVRCCKKDGSCSTNN